MPLLSYKYFKFIVIKTYVEFNFMFLDQLAADVYIKFKDGRWGAVKVLSPLRQVADSSPLISICYRRTVAFRSGARFSFASVTPF